MLAVSEYKKIADLSVGEFRNLIKETFYEIIEQGPGLRLEYDGNMKTSLRSEGKTTFEKAGKNILRKKALTAVGRFASGVSDISERHDDYLSQAYGNEKYNTK